MQIQDMGKVKKMSKFDKIWIEVDVEPDREKKTEKIKEVLEKVSEIPCVKNVAKITYQKNVTKLQFSTEEE